MGGRQVAEDDLQHSIQVGEDVRVPEAQHAEALRAQIGVPRRVTLDPLFRPVLPTINLDHKPCREADEINDKVIDGGLLPEVIAPFLEFPERTPEMSLSIGLIAS